MSRDYWAIEGYGINTEDIMQYVNKDKVIGHLKRLIPNAIFEEDIFDDDVFCGDPYSNFAEFLCELDETETMSWNDDANGESYFLYEPRYPWHIKENDPKSYEEAEEIILNVLNKVCDIDMDNTRSIDEIRQHIYDISTYGCC